MKWNEEKDKLGKEILLELYKKGMIKTWYRDKPTGWILKSGVWSPFYIQLRELPSYPKLLEKVGYALGKLISEEITYLNRILGVAMAGIPIAIAITLSNNIPSCYSRKLERGITIEDFDTYIKKYGEHSVIEGIFKEGDNVGIIDDLVTKFDSKIEAIQQLELEIKLRKLENINISDVIVLFDREQGAKESAKERGINLHALIPFMSKGEIWLKDILSEKEHEIIFDYLRNPESYQNDDIQNKLLNL